MTNEPRKHSRLSWRLAITYASIFSLLLFALNAGVLYGVRLFLISQATDSVNSIGKAIIEDVAGSTDEKAALSDPELVNEVGANYAVSVRIASPNGTVINESNNYKMPGPSFTEKLGLVRQVRIGNEDYLVKNYGISDTGGLNIAYLQILINLDRENDFTQVLLILMIAATVLGVFFSLLAGFFTSKRMLSPIDRLANAVECIDVHDLDTRVEEGKADDELSRLARMFNQMLDRLKLSFQRQARFVSDASHELRTPIAVIRGYAGLLDKWGAENKSIFDESVQAITSETMEMTELMEKLLFLAKSDNNILPIRASAFRLADLLEEVAAESRMVSPSHIITCGCSEWAEIYADRLMIKQALRALMENSIKFTPAQGSIRLSAEVKDRDAAITVSDSGIGVPEGEISNIFERFYRLDKSRSKDTGGSGLGLSIVQLIAQAHGGTVTAESRPGEGLTVSILIPIGEKRSGG